MKQSRVAKSSIGLTHLVPGLVLHDNQNGTTMPNIVFGPSVEIAVIKNKRT